MRKIEIVKTPGKQQAKVTDLFLWADNPKDVEASDYDRLKLQMQLGEHSPLLITTEGEVLGGNTRLSLYKELKREFADVVVVELVPENGKVRAYVNGDKAQRKFDSIGQAKLEYALSHNGQIGKTNRERLSEMAIAFDLPTEVYEVATYVQPVEAVVQSLSPEANSVEEDSSEDSTGSASGHKTIVLHFSYDEYLAVRQRLDAMIDPEESDTELFMRMLKSFEEGHLND